MTRSERLYRRLLRLYPREFRDEYGEEMSLVFRDRTSERSVRLWLQVLGDFLFHAPKEHWSVMKQDLRYAVRTLLRAPTFAVTVIATLALGIGANAVIFSAVDAVLLRAAPVSDPGTLVEVYTSDSSGRNLYAETSYPDYFDLRDSGTFASLAAFTEVPLTLEANGQPEPVAGELVSGNYFEVLGVAMAVGRGFAPDEDRIGSPVRVAVISHGLWQRLFNADRTLAGRTVRLNSHPYTLIGVAPPGFGGPVLGVATEAWVPAALKPEVDRRAGGAAAIFDRRSSRGLRMVGRLPGGTSIEQLASRAAIIASRLQSAYPETNRNRRFTLTPLGEGRSLRVATRPILRQLGAAVVMVLLVVCANVASLLLSRAVTREREVAVRLAIGASRARLVRQWITESVLLGACGSIAALAVVWLATPLLHSFVLPDAVDLSMNARVLGFTLIVGLGSGLLFGLAPALQVRRRDTVTSLRAEGGSVATGARAARMRGAFVMLQVAVSLVLLVGAGLFLRTLSNAYSVDLGYRIDRVLVAAVNLQAGGYFEGGPQGIDAGVAVYEKILSGIEALPGVAAASAARMTVLSGGHRATAVSTDGRPLQKDQSNALSVRANVVSHRYFQTMQIPVLQGRAFDALDGPATARVTVVTKSLADRAWPHQEPIGKTFWDERRQFQVVGVVPDTVYTSTVEREGRPTYYALLSQNFESGVTLHVRAADSPLALAPGIREAVRQVDSQLAVGRPELLGDVLDRTLSTQRMLATLVGLFGAVALLLAALGLYGVMSNFATQRTPEIGLRLALGAQPASIIRLLLRQSVRLLGTGAVIGLTGAFLGTRYIESQLFGVTATDPVTFVSACVVLAIAGVTASLIPAIRAMRIDPVSALRRA